MFSYPWPFCYGGHKNYIFGMLMQVKLCVNEKIPVIPIPGPSALVAGLSASGLATDEFTFGKLLMNTPSLLWKFVKCTCNKMVYLYLLSCVSFAVYSWVSAETCRIKKREADCCRK